MKPLTKLAISWIFAIFAVLAGFLLVHFLYNPAPPPLCDTPHCAIGASITRQIGHESNVITTTLSESQNLRQEENAMQKIIETEQRDVAILTAALKADIKYAWSNINACCTAYPQYCGKLREDLANAFNISKKMKKELSNADVQIGQMESDTNSMTRQISAARQHLSNAKAVSQHYLNQRHQYQNTANAMAKSNSTLRTLTTRFTALSNLMSSALNNVSALENTYISAHNKKQLKKKIYDASATALEIARKEQEDVWDQYKYAMKLDMKMIGSFSFTTVKLGGLANSDTLTNVTQGSVSSSGTSKSCSVNIKGGDKKFTFSGYFTDKCSNAMKLHTNKLPLYSNGLPVGSYTDSCSLCTYNNSNLSCTCTSHRNTVGGNKQILPYSLNTQTGVGYVSGLGSVSTGYGCHMGITFSGNNGLQCSLPSIPTSCKKEAWNQGWSGGMTVSGCGINKAYEMLGFDALVQNSAWSYVKIPPSGGFEVSIDVSTVVDPSTYTGIFMSTANSSNWLSQIMNADPKLGNPWMCKYRPDSTYQGTCSDSNCAEPNSYDRLPWSTHDGYRYYIQPTITSSTTQTVVEPWLNPMFTSNSNSNSTSTTTQYYFSKAPGRETSLPPTKVPCTVESRACSSPYAKTCVGNFSSVQTVNTYDTAFETYSFYVPGYYDQDWYRRIQCRRYLYYYRYPGPIPEKPTFPCNHNNYPNMPAGKWVPRQLLQYLTPQKAAELCNHRACSFIVQDLKTGKCADSGCTYKKVSSRLLYNDNAVPFYTSTTVADCKNKCDSIPNCRGFSSTNNTCWLGKSSKTTGDSYTRDNVMYSSKYISSNNFNNGEWSSGSCNDDPNTLSTMCAPTSTYCCNQNYTTYQGNQKFNFGSVSLTESAQSWNNVPNVYITTNTHCNNSNCKITMGSTNQQTGKATPTSNCSTSLGYQTISFQNVPKYSQSDVINISENGQMAMFFGGKYDCSTRMFTIYLRVVIAGGRNNKPSNGIVKIGDVTNPKKIGEIFVPSGDTVKLRVQHNLDNSLYVLAKTSSASGWSSMTMSQSSIPVNISSSGKTIPIGALYGGPMVCTANSHNIKYTAQYDTEYISAPWTHNDLVSSSACPSAPVSRDISKVLTGCGKITTASVSGCTNCTDNVKAGVLSCESCDIKEKQQCFSYNGKSYLGSSYSCPPGSQSSGFRSFSYYPECGCKICTPCPKTKPPGKPVSINYKAQNCTGVKNVFGELKCDSVKLCSPVKQSAGSCGKECVSCGTLCGSNYSSTCEGCFAENGVLTCTSCEDNAKNKNTNPSITYKNCKGVTNNNGNLECRSPC